MELFAAEVMPQFKEREAKREKIKEKELEPYIEAANQKIKVPQPMEEIPPVEAYPLIWEKMSTSNPQGTPDRRPGMTAFWQMQVGGKRSKE
jgi:hypothetical protein